MLGNTVTAFAASMPGGDVTNPAVRAVDVAQPAVVRIITTIEAHLSVHLSATKTVTFPQSDRGYPLQLSGSGTFVTAQGDIVTADHVVNPPRDQLLSQFLDETAAQDVANYINQNAKAGATPLTKDQVSQALQSRQIASDAQYNTPTSIVFLSTAYTGLLSAPDFQSLPQQMYAQVDKIEQESAANQEDVAIVHAPFKDMPSVQLADSSTVQPQDELTIIGFPGNGDVSNRPTDLLTSSVNKINVSSIKTTDSGAPVIQVGGNVEHGDSGGPALDNQGNIVGIVSFGLSGPNGSGGTSFLQASNSASAMIKSLGLDTTPGAFQKLWTQAFDNYASATPGHWHLAQKDFNQLATSYPLFQAVKPYLNYAQSQAQTERISTPTPNAQQQAAAKSSSGTKLFGFNINPTTALIVAVSAVVLLLLLIMLLFSLIRRRNKKDKKPVGVPGTLAAARPQIMQTQPMQPVQRPPAPIPAPPTVPGSPGAMPVSGSTSTILRAWPCGHLNRLNARFCTVCGEPAPTPIRQTGQ